jgi:beta-galactosidase
MWEKMYTSEGCLGGAIWSGIDDIFHLPTGRAIGYGSWGPVDGWRRTKPEYWHIKKTYSPIKIQDKTINIPDKGEPIKLHIENRHDFTNLSEIRIEWTLSGETGMAKANIPPQTSGTISIQSKSTDDLNGKKLSLKFFSPRGFMIDSYLLPIGTSEEIIPKPGISANGSLGLVKDGNNLTIKGNRFTWVFDRKTGLIEMGEIDDQTVLIGGPTLMVLPLTGGKCEPTHSEEIQPFNNTCRNWKANKVTAIETADSVEIHVDGQYEEAFGRYLIRLYSSGQLVVDYHFTLNGNVNPRQTGIVFDLPKIYDNLAWKRNAQWTVYPEDHIGRVEGQAKAFRSTKWPTMKHRTEPLWPWSLDSNALGTNDFRSTKRNIIWASLKDADGYGILVRSAGNQSTRSFVDGGRIRLVVAGYSTGGADLFFASHLANERRPLKKGGVLEDTVHLELVSPSK